MLDTVLNIFSFVFIGVLIWLYFKESGGNAEDLESGTKRESNGNGP